MDSKNKFEIVLQNSKIKEIYDKSIELNLPILRDKTVELLLNIIDEYNIKNCLEIGTAIGYSSAIMNEIKQVNVVTIEKDLTRYELAKCYLSSNQNITCINDDCFNYSDENLYDMIILDGPKANQIDLIEKYWKNTKVGSIFFIDNIYMKKFINITNKTNNQIKILNNLKKLENYLLNNVKLKGKIYDIDDGVAIFMRVE